jgi:hypothetical protein
MRKTLKKHTPPSIWQSSSSAWYALKRATLWPSANLHPQRRDSMRQLAGYKNKHQGERCFIIGNGPSLRQMDLTLLNQDKTFGLNRIYLLFPELGFTTTYYLSINNLVVEQCAADIRGLLIPKFISWRAHKLIGPVPDMVFLHTTYSGPRFAQDARGRLWEGATVTYVALQLAYHMGFQQVILIGVDHNFSTQGSPNTTVVSQGDDPDHFHPQYFGRGFRWQLPDLDTSERAYTLARQAFQQSGREVLDATVGGKLNVFPKVEYKSLF